MKRKPVYVEAAEEWQRRFAEMGANVAASAERATDEERRHELRHTALFYQELRRVCESWLEEKEHEDG